MGSGNTPSDNGNLAYTARLDHGLDTFQGTLASGFFLTAGVVRIDVDGGANNDTLVMEDAAGAGTIDGTALLDIRLDGGLGVDSSTDLAPMVSLTNVDVLAGDAVHGLRLRVSGGEGFDAIFVDITDPDPLTDGNYDITLRGDDGNDTVDLEFVDADGLTLGPDGKILLDGGLGTDTVDGTGAGATFRIINEP